MFNRTSRATTITPNWMQEKSTGLSAHDIGQWDLRNVDLNDWWDWFTGEALQEEEMEAPMINGRRPYVYPLQINLIRTGLLLQAAALAGEVPDTEDPLVSTVVHPKADTDAARAVAQEVEEVVRQLEYQNHTRGMDADMFLAIQALGSMVLKVREEEPSDLLPLGIRWEYFDPREFFCRWEGTEYLDLTEAWIRQEISAEDARQLGVDPGHATAQYLEHWDRERYWIKIDGKFATDRQGIVDRAHPYGFVPFLYVPRLRANDFWGVSPVPDVVGLVKEYNARMADTGDATHMSVFDRLVMRNVRTGYPAEISLKDGSQVLNIGRQLSAGEGEPDLFRPGGPKLPDGAANFTEMVKSLARQGLSTPAVAYGEDEGSQRSGITLWSRMWPLISDIRRQRTWWTLARNRRVEMSLKILRLRGLGDLTEAHLGHRMRQVWAAPLPVDRAQIVDEMIRRKQEHLGSLRHILTRLGDVPDIEAEIAAIWADLDKQVELDAKLIQAKTPGQGLAAGKGKV
jgi:hypothetical protein